ncbi:MAG: stage II sporulation protein R [Clostridia bacterium]|nr:stage II sporulation protein R [Clostridia bacterium]
MFKNKACNFKRDKILLSVFGCALSLYLAFSCTYFAGAANTVREDVVRLHILANSDSKADQKVKLQVRDALLEKNTLILSDGVSKENAVEYFELSKGELLEAADEVLRENGFDYGVKLSLEKEYFETREYGELTFPAGEYTALKVILGEGEGKNWWCVMFPPLCIPAAGEVEIKENTDDYLTESGNEIVNGGKKYVIKFKLLEVYEELKNSIRNS